MYDYDRFWNKRSIEAKKLNWSEWIMGIQGWYRSKYWCQYVDLIDYEYSVRNMLGIPIVDSIY